jgi:hypothetical protein
MSGKDFGSLTIEPPLKNLDDTIAAIKPGMTYAALRDFAKQNTHGDAPGLIRRRFVQVGEDKTVAYDRFLSLVATHGISSPVVRKTMLFVWAFGTTSDWRACVPRRGPSSGYNRRHPPPAQPPAAVPPVRPSKKAPKTRKLAQFIKARGVTVWLEPTSQLGRCC